MVTNHNKNVDDSKEPAAINHTDIARRLRSKDKNSKTPRIRVFEKNRELLNYLVDAYRSNEKLWNPNHPKYKYNASRNVFNELSGPLLRDLKYELNGAEIFSIIDGLRARYRRELTKVKTRSGSYKPQFWCYEKFDFLRNIIENKRAERAAKNGLDNIIRKTKLRPNAEIKSIKSREILGLLINAFKQNECLWNPQHQDYLNGKRSELYDKIASEIGEFNNVILSGDVCYSEIQQIQSRYRKELKKLNSRSDLYVPKLWYFEELSFLRLITEDREKNCTKDQQYSKSRLFKEISFANEEEQQKFIQIYKNYPTLWNFDHPDYRSSTYRKTSFQQMLKEIRLSLKLEIKGEELQRTLNQLRKDYSAQKRNLLSNKIKKNSRSSLTPIIYAQLSDFLDIHLGPFRCEYCAELVRTSDQYKIHKYKHDGLSPFNCILCGKGFQAPGNLAVHIRRHKRDFPFVCEVCDKRFATSTEIGIHMRSHTGERPYICDLCGKSFKTWSFFNVHRRIHLNQSNFHCPICDKSFYERNRYTDHMNGHLNIRQHICNVCKKGFTTFASLKKHNELHLPVKKYKCVNCGKRFAQFASLRWHKRTNHIQTQYEP